MHHDVSTVGHTDKSWTQKLEVWFAGTIIHLHGFNTKILCPRIWPTGNVNIVSAVVGTGRHSICPDTGQAEPVRPMRAEIWQRFEPAL